LAETGNQVLRRYLEEILAAEKALAAQLREFATAETDDAEVQNVLAAHAEQTHTQEARLAKRLQALGGETGLHVKNPLSALFHNVQQLPHTVHAPEERSLRNLLTSYTAETGEIVVYEALANLASAAGDPETEALAREIQEFVKVQLAAHEYPRFVQFAETLPMTATGKVLRRELRARG